MPDLWGIFRHSPKPPKSKPKSSDDALTDGFQNLSISGSDATRNGGRSSRENGRVEHTRARVANGVARLTVTPPGTPPVSRSRSDQPRSGGAARVPPPSGNHLHRPTQSLQTSSPTMEMPTPRVYPSQASPTYPSTKPQMTMPIPPVQDEGYSLTMQYAVIGPTDLDDRPQVGSHTFPTSAQVEPGLRPPYPTVPPRPYSDPTVPHASASTPVSLSGPSTPPRQKLGSAARPPDSAPTKLTKANVTAHDANMSSPTTKRHRAASSPSLTTSPNNQCWGMTTKSERCKNKVGVKNTSGLARLNPKMEDEMPRFCHIHLNGVLEESLTYVNGKQVVFDNYLPRYLQPSTLASMRVKMAELPSEAEEEGYIYTFEIIDPTDKDHVHLKVGRAVNLNKRIQEWRNQCKSKEQILRGWWPGHQNNRMGLLKGTVKPGLPGHFTHKLEHLVHLELADLMLNAPYLSDGWPNLTSAPEPSPKPTELTRKTCVDCGVAHKEIFSFRHMKGKNKGREYDLLVKPVIARWGDYLQSMYGADNASDGD
ncbi:hypothetical protein EIP91_002603 [Steccherinum ochraceum]|uniref:DUF1766-domain-containing protein n=1 Tax=Steccherinum ochraceum TaxID=92696 RepID=A0A4R0RT91_9APHY|nr:hypothetical protein EIP91_002603 [Steccherinum ochraceum]